MFKCNVDIFETTLPSNASPNITPILIGVCVGVVVIIIAILFECFLCSKYRRNRKPQKTKTNGENRQVKMEAFTNRNLIKATMS